MPKTKKRSYEQKLKLKRESSRAKRAKESKKVTEKTQDKKNKSEIDVEIRREQNRIYMRTKRMDIAFRSDERVKNKLYMRKCRNNDEFLQISRDRNREYMRKKRANEEFRSKEKQRDKLYKRENREDKKYLETLREQNRAFFHDTLHNILNKQITQNEENKARASTGSVIAEVERNLAIKEEPEEEPTSVSAIPSKHVDENN